MARRHRFESPALQYAYDRFVGSDSGRQAEFEQALVNAEIALMLYRLRSEAGLTQAQLARRVGTTPSVISRLEDADYEGHSLAMLRRVAGALDRRVELRFVRSSGRRTPRPGRKRPAA